MKDAEITQTIVRHLCSDVYEGVEGILHGENYFIVVLGAREDRRPNSRIAYGNGMDVLAHMIEEDLFFGAYLDHKPEKADSSSNGRIRLIDEKATISGTFNVETTQTGLLIAVNKIDKVDCLDLINSATGFVTAATLYGVEGDIEEIAARLYKQ
jgi:hypothetical protein